MRKKCFVLLICVFIGLLIFSVISCSKKLNPFNPYAGLENEPKWFLKPEDQIKPFMQDTLIFRSEVNNNNPDSPKKIYRIPGITVSEKKYYNSSC